MSGDLRKRPGIVLGILGFIALLVVRWFMGQEAAYYLMAIFIIVTVIALENVRESLAREEKETKDLTLFIYHLSKKQDIECEIKQYLERIGYSQWGTPNALKTVLMHGRTLTGESKKKE
jgi:hypothetical protein